MGHMDTSCRLRVGDPPIDPPDMGPDTCSIDRAERLDAAARDEIANARRLGGQTADDLAEAIGSSKEGYQLLHAALVQFVIGNEGECINILNDALHQAALEWQR